MAVQDVGVRAVLENLQPFLAGTGAMDRSLNSLNKATTNTAQGADFANRALFALAGTITAFAAAAAVAVGKAVEFEHAMAGIKAVSGASAMEMQSLTDAALKTGTQFGFTATEVAGAEEALIKAGVSIGDVLGGALPAALTLAAAGSIDVQTAAEIAANALNQFSLKGSDMAHVADLIAGAANASAIDVKDLGLSLQQAGAVAALAGQTLDSTTQAIAVLGTAGIKSSDAGTSLKTMLQNLQPQSKNAAEVMQLLGLRTEAGANAFFDAQGKAKSFKDIAGVLQGALSGLTEQQKLATLSIIFGSDASRAAAILAREGAAGFDDMAAGMAKVTAEAVAAERLNDLTGDIQKLKAAVSAIAIATETEMTPALRGGVQALIELAERAGPAANGIGNILGEAFLRGAQLAVIFAEGAKEAAAALKGLSGAAAEMQATTRANYGADDPGRTRFGNLQDFSSLSASVDDWSHNLDKATGAMGRSEAEASKLRGQLGGLLNSFVSDKGGGLKKGAEDVKTAFEELGVGFDILRRAGEDLKLSQETVDRAILSVGGTALDTGPIVDRYGQTVTRLAAAFSAAGLDGKALVDQIMALNAATKAKEEADKAAAKAKQEQEEATRAAEEAARKAAEDAKRAREAVTAGIVGESARDVLGGLRGRAPKDASQAASDFNAAASGLSAIATAGLETDVALDLMEKRLGNLAGQFAQLTGDDLASAGATTDGIRKLIAAFRAGTIGVEEFDAGMQKFTGELSRLGGVVDEVAAKFKKFEEENAARVAQDAINTATDKATSALQLQRDELNNGLGPAWARLGKTMAQAMKEFEDSIAAARQQVDQLLALQGILLGRQNDDLDSGARARTAAAKFGSSLKEGMTTAEIAAAFQEAFNSGGRPDDIFQQIFFGAIGEILMRAGITIAPAIGQSLATAIQIALGLPGAGGIESFGNGGTVGGPAGAPRLVLAHGGETITPQRPDLAMLPLSAGGASRYDRSVTYNLTANYSNPQTPQGIRYDLQTLQMLAGT